MQNAGGADLGSFLRSRRATMTPPTGAGGSRHSHRRVPGLRRQELAEIASISVEYYTRLEQGRAPRPSRDVLAALARSFELTAAERDHLFRLAGELPPTPSEPSGAVRPGLLRLIDQLGPAIPITVHDGRLDVVALNSFARELFGSVTGGGSYGRNIVHRAFTSPVFTELLDAGGIDQLLRVATAELRAALARYPDDPYLLGLIQDLTVRPEFRERWEHCEVGFWRSAFKRIRHPERGWLDVDTEMLHDPERDHWVTLYSVRPHTPDAPEPPGGQAGPRIGSSESLRI
ncbi:helix-turn-helix transcriptional regulator [Pseudonocardia sp. Ae707_Ps1]|uniref:helix-turn-helix transcriptional regulator n=1 Tax=Pseudonocardia sp. Ae707_Ps1 TaxID=1885572 RepID=UPI0002FD30BF|nr:helix-turn-helix transcriptional regulator [Pseudonocardia sp. Ae707_Ps1]